MTEPCNEVGEGIPDWTGKAFIAGRRYQHQRDVDRLKKAMGHLGPDEERPGFVIWGTDWDAFVNLKIEGE